MRIFLPAKRFGLFLISFALLAGLVLTAPANAISGTDSMPKPESLGRIDSDVVRAARIHLIQNSPEWDIDTTQFQPTAAIRGVAGMSVVRFVQSIGGVEVANSLLAITVSNDGSLLSYTKSISDYSGESQPPISQAQATEALKLVLSKQLGISTSHLVVSEMKLVIVDGSLVNDVPSGEYLAWRATT